MRINVCLGTSAVTEHQAADASVLTYIGRHFQRTVSRYPATVIISTSCF